MSARPWFPLVAAVVSGAASLGAATLLAGALQRRAAATSHELPAAGRRLLLPAERTPELVHRGAGLFLNSCAHCHGADAHGDEGPDLHGLQVSDRRIATVIRNGIPDEMPSFAKKHGDADTRALIAYLRSLD